MSKTTTIARIRPDGKVVKVTAAGEVEFPAHLAAPPAERRAACDRSEKPMTPDELRRSRKVPRVKTLRRALGLTQEEFASRYHIPLGTLRDWEQGRTEPDQPAKAFLRVIAKDPEKIYRLLAG
ncbi:MAG: helix-turn-helix domain-containing protein [Steroidobacteraceae bacterium]